MTTQSGYSRLALIVVVMLISILLAVFLGRMDNVVERTRELKIEYTALNLQTSIRRIHQIWIMRGKPNVVEVESPTNENNQTVFLNDDGWPVVKAMRKKSLTKLTDKQCADLWMLLLHGKESTVTTNRYEKKAHFLAKADGTVCFYEYIKGTSSRDAQYITFMPQKGLVSWAEK